MTRFMLGMLHGSVDRFGIDDLRLALDRLARHPGVDAQRLGAVGYCLGGTLAIAWACTDNRLRAIAPHYSFNPRPLEALRRSCPVVGSFPSWMMTTAGHGPACSGVARKPGGGPVSSASGIVRLPAPPLVLHLPRALQRRLAQARVVHDDLRAPGLPIPGADSRPLPLRQLIEVFGHLRNGRFGGP